MTWLDTFNTILFWIFLFVLIWQAYILLFNKGVPNIRTAPAIRRKIIELLKADYEAKGAPDSYTIIDLGSGNGLFTRQIARALPGAKVIGIETAKAAFNWAEKMRVRAGLDNLEYRNEDFFACDLRDVDAVIMYLTIYEMGRVGEKLMDQLKPGALVTSNRFPLGGGWTPEQSLKVFTLYPHQRTLNVYRKQGVV
jgi:precorrin-6B methylase 2